MTNIEDRIKRIQRFSPSSVIGGAAAGVVKTGLKKKKIIALLKERKREGMIKRRKLVPRKRKEMSATDVRDKVMNTGAKVIGADKLVKAGYETGKALGKAADAYSNFFRKAGQATRKRIDSELDARRRAEENAEEKWRKLNR